MMKFIPFDILRFSFFEIYPLKPKKTTYRAGIGPPRRKGPG